MPQKSDEQDTQGGVMRPSPPHAQNLAFEDRCRNRRLSILPSVMVLPCLAVSNHPRIGPLDQAGLIAIDDPSRQVRGETLRAAIKRGSAHHLPQIATDLIDARPLRIV